jgi:hypothetical protein
VRKWKSAVTISNARTYRAVFCTARTWKAAGWSSFDRYNVLIDHRLALELSLKPVLVNPEMYF